MAKMEGARGRVFNRELFLAEKYLSEACVSRAQGHRSPGDRFPQEGCWRKKEGRAMSVSEKSGLGWGHILKGTPRFLPQTLMWAAPATEPQINFHPEKSKNLQGNTATCYKWVFLNSHENKT